MNQFVNSLQTNDTVKTLMKQFDRYHFCVNKSDAYIDKPSQLFLGQTISAPHMHAKAIEYLEPVLKPGSTILDIGSGSGYLTACFGEAVKVYHEDESFRGKVIGIDIVPELVDYSVNIIQNKYKNLYHYKRNFKIFYKDGKLGHPSKRNEEIINNKSNIAHLRIPAISVTITIYIQLIIGAIMRHTESGLAIPDFPMSGGFILPLFNQAMVDAIHSMHFDAGLQFVEFYQIIIHFAHRIGALAVSLAIGYLSLKLFQLKIQFSIVHKLLLMMIFLLIIQIFLGAMTIWTVKNPLITSIHVLNGAIILGTSALFILNVRPLNWIK